MRKVTSDESTKMENQREILQPIPDEAKTDGPQRQMTMEDFWRPVIQDEYSSMRHPPIEANNFELKPALITMVQQLIRVQLEGYLESTKFIPILLTSVALLLQYSGSRVEYRDGFSSGRWLTVGSKL